MKGRMLSSVTTAYGGNDFSMGNMTLTPVVGAGLDVVKAGIGTVEFKGTTSNAYGGTMFVNSGALTLNKTSGALAVSGAVSLEDATLTFSGTLGDEPVTLLTAGTSLTGAFATVNNQPPYSALRYIDNSVVIAKDLPTLIVIK